MRKMTILILILCILVTNAATYANSGPTYWDGYPSSEILTIDENSPIAVEKEDLIFDFTMDENIKHASYSITGLVTAKYTMTNRSEDGQTVQMAFPFISSIQDFNPEAIGIKVNNENIPFEVYIGSELNNRNRTEDREEQLDFSSIVKTISSSEYIPTNYDLNEIGTLYTFDVKSEGQEFINIAVEHNINRDKSRIMSKGFNGYQVIEGTESFIAGIYENENYGYEVPEIFHTGEDIEFNFNAYLDGELKEETDNYILDLKTEEISVRDYLLRDVEVSKEKLDYLDYLADNQIFNLYARKTDEFIEKNVMNLGNEILLSQNSVERVFLLIYEVSFQENSSHDVSVSYISRGAMDRRETAEPIYTFDYILNPARNWESFNNLNILIKPPTEHPYIIESSLELIRQEDGVYRGTFEKLPDADFSFSLYNKEKITTMDRIKGYFDKNKYLIIALIPVILGIILGIVNRAIYKRLKRGKK